MSSHNEANNIIDLDLPSIQVVLAESNPFEVTRIRLNIDQEFQSGIKVAKSYNELIAMIIVQRPQLVLLGRIDRFNYFDICRDCHEIREKLPIFLISREDSISESFLKLAKTRGLTDIVESDSTKINLLFKAIGKPVYLPQISGELLEIPIVGQTMLGWLEQIVAISSKYFGPLAQGNYWRKSRAHVIDQFPFISNWSVDHFSKISCNEVILTQALTDDDIQGLCLWVKLFMAECERIITDFRSILNNSDLSLLAKDLLTKS